MFAQGAAEFLEAQRQLALSGDALADLKVGMHFFVGFCTSDPVRYQLLFQRTIPDFEPSPESFAIAVEGLEATRDRLQDMGFADPAVLDLLTAIGTGLTDQQISNDPGGDRWVRLVDEAMEMFFAHVSNRIAPAAPTRATHQEGKEQAMTTAVHARAAGARPRPVRSGRLAAAENDRFVALVEVARPGRVDRTDGLPGLGRAGTRLARASGRWRRTPRSPSSSTSSEPARRRPAIVPTSTA